MRKLYIIIGFLLFFSGAVKSQDRFYNLFEGWESHCIFECDSVYQIFGMNSLGYQEHIFLSYSITKSGDSTTNQFEFFDSTYLSTTSIISGTSSLLSERLFYATGNFLVNNNDFFYPYLLKLDYPLNDTILFRKYNNLNQQTDTSNQFHQIIKKGSFLYIFGQSYDLNYHVTMSFYKMDTMGNLIYARNYLPTGNYSYSDISRPNQILPTDDNGFILTFEEYQHHPADYNTNSYAMKIDSLGNEEWRLMLGHNDTVNLRPFVFPKPNGDYFATYCDPEVVVPGGSTTHGNDSATIWLCEFTVGQYYPYILQKHDLSNDVQGFLKGGPYKVNDVYVDSSRNMYLAGRVTYYDFMSFLLKIDSTGTGKWIQYYNCFPNNTASSKQTKVYGLTATSDGGFIMAGEYSSSDSPMFPGGIQSSLIIKLDSCGCLTAGCNPYCTTVGKPVIQTISMHDLNIYPNPASDKINIEAIENETKASGSGVLRIFTSTGEICITKQHKTGESLNINKLNSGVYTARLNMNGKFFTGRFVKE